MHEPSTPVPHVRGGGLAEISIFHAGHDAAERLPPEVVVPLASVFGRPWLETLRVHRDADGSEAAARWGARAATVGGDIILGGELAAKDAADPRVAGVLAHEVVHAHQQRGASWAEGPARVGGSVAAEEEARRFVRSLEVGRHAGRYGRVAGFVEPEAGRRPGVRPVERVSSPTVQLVELSYDDGPDSAGHTRRILQHLDAAGARATFYLVGRRIQQGDNWRVVFDIVASGHWLGNHAFDWNLEEDDHVWLEGTVEERAAKVLATELAIRDALIRGRNEAVATGMWAGIPQENRDYIDDVIAHGTGRFRTPGFKSKWWKKEERTTTRALKVVNEVMKSAGLRTFAITKVASFAGPVEGVTVDPQDWQPGSTSGEIEDVVQSELDDEEDTILLHSRVAATEDATPGIVSAIRRRGFSFMPTVRGELPGAKGSGFGAIATNPSWVRRFMEQVEPIGPKTVHESSTIQHPAESRTHQNGIVWLRHSDGNEYLTLVSVTNQGRPRRSTIVFLAFVDGDLQGLAESRALQVQPQGIQSLSWEVVDWVPSSPPDSVASRRAR